MGDTLKPLTMFCGKLAETSKALKMQVDGVGFDRAQGFLHSSVVSDDALFAAQNLSIVIQRGASATDAAKTYLAGSLPTTLLKNMLNTVDPAQIGPDEPSYYGYFVHRHSLYALAEFFGWSWKQSGIPEGQVHTGTTVFIELRRNSTGGLTVEMKQWNPHCGETNATSCPREPIPLSGCSMSGGSVCSLNEFAGMIQTRNDRTGDWSKL